MGIGEGEEESRKKEIQDNAQRKKQRDRAPEGFSRDVNSFLWQEPQADGEDRDNKEQEADGVAIGREVLYGWIHGWRDGRGVQGKRGRYGNHHQNADDQQKACARRRGGDGVCHRLSLLKSGRRYHTSQFERSTSTYKNNL